MYILNIPFNIEYAVILFNSQNYLNTLPHLWTVHLYVMDMYVDSKRKQEFQREEYTTHTLRKPAHSHSLSDTCKNDDLCYHILTNLLVLVFILLFESVKTF